MNPSTLPLPSTWHHQMQMGDPVHYDPDFRFYFGGQGTWQVYRYKDAQRVLSDSDIFSNEYMPKSEDNLPGSNLNQTAPPRHKQLYRCTWRIIPVTFPWHLMKYIAFEVILERMGNIRFKTGFPPVPTASTIMAGSRICTSHLI